MSVDPTANELIEVIDDLADGYVDHLLGCPMLSREMPCDCGLRALLGRAEQARQAAGAPACPHHDTAWHADPVAAGARTEAEFCRRCGASRQSAGDSWQDIGTAAGRPMVVWVSDETWQAGLTETRAAFVWGELRRVVRDARAAAFKGDHPKAARLLTSARCTSLIAPDALLPDTPHPPEELDAGDAESATDADANADAAWPDEDEQHTASCRHQRFQFIPTPGVVAAWVGWELCHDCGATRTIDGDHIGPWSPSGRGGSWDRP